MDCKEIYTLKVDSRVILTSNHLPYMKKIANETLELGTGFFAEILRYDKTYSFRFYNTKWSR